VALAIAVTKAAWSFSIHARPLQSQPHKTGCGGFVLVAFHHAVDHHVGLHLAKLVMKISGQPSADSPAISTLRHSGQAHASGIQPALAVTTCIAGKVEWIPARLIYCCSADRGFSRSALFASVSTNHRGLAKERQARATTTTETLMTHKH
jgi:hypothetical protein